LTEQRERSLTVKVVPEEWAPDKRPSRWCWDETWRTRVRHLHLDTTRGLRSSPVTRHRQTDRQTDRHRYCMVCHVHSRLL